MVFELVIPQPGIKPNSTKGAVISVLATDWPLSVKQIHHLIKKRYGAEVTYQAVHKTIKHLLAKKVIQEDKAKYKLSLRWLIDVQDFVGKIEELYMGKEKERVVTYEDNVSTMTFKTVSDLNRYFMSLDLVDGENIYIECAHMWWALFHSELAYSRLKRMRQARNKAYVICRGNTIPDSWCADFERQEGSIVTTGVSCAMDCDLYAYGDTAIRIYYPKKLMDIVEKSYESVDNIHDLDLVDLFSNFFEAQEEIYLVVNKNPSAANKAKQRILECLNKNALPENR